MKKIVKAVKRVAKKFSATEGAQFDKDKAQVYGECLNKIAERNGGKFKPIDVVEEARNPRNPLHSIFEWDNTKAAEKYRVEQARHLINHITVEIKYDNTVRNIKGWFSINETPNEKRMNKIYVNVERVMGEPELRHQVLLSAIEEAEFWKEKYYQYKELSNIFVSIDKTKKKLLIAEKKISARSKKTKAKAKKK
jgi:hypothetical protein